MEDLRVLVFGYTVESIMQFYLSLALVGIKVPWKKMILASLFSATLDFFLRPLFARYLGLPESTEIIISVLVMLIIFRYYFKISFGVSLISLFLGLIAGSIGQALMFVILKSVNIDIEVISKGVWWKKLIIGHIANLINYLLIIILMLKPFNIIDFSKREGTFIN